MLFAAKVREVEQSVHVCSFLQAVWLLMSWSDRSVLRWIVQSVIEKFHSTQTSAMELSHISHDTSTLDLSFQGRNLSYAFSQHTDLSYVPLLHVAHASTVELSFASRDFSDALSQHTDLS